RCLSRPLAGRPARRTDQPAAGGLEPARQSAGGGLEGSPHSRGGGRTGDRRHGRADSLRLVVRVNAASYLFAEPQNGHYLTVAAVCFAVIFVTGLAAWVVARRSTFAAVRR